MSTVQQVTRRASDSGGFTLIELMIVVAIIAIILTLALPVYSNYSIRAKVAESLSVTAAAKTATASTCVETPTLTGLTPAAIGYSYSTSTYVSSIDISGTCAEPVITVYTQNTGTSPDAELTLTGNFADGGHAITWTCAANVSNIYLPSTCRS